MKDVALKLKDTLNEKFKHLEFMRVYLKEVNLML